MRLYGRLVGVFSRMAEVALIGAGSIARIHADALRSLGHTVSAVIDPNEAAAAALAGEGVATYRTLEAAIAAGGFDRAHVLSPPDLHAPLAETLLRAGRAAFVEKPLATSASDCDRLIEIAADHRAPLGVNQNFVHHPAFVRARGIVDSGRVGRVRFISCIYHVPLRQLAARQFGHWMFHEPGNILLEQAVHPLSQIVALAGLPTEVQAMAGPPMAITDTLPFVKEVTATLRCADIVAQFRQSVGEPFPFWQLTIACEDGVVVADMLANRAFSTTRTGLLEAVDAAVAGVATGASLAGRAAMNLVEYASSQAGLGKRRDAFFLSMQGSIGAFHTAVDEGRPPVLDGAFGGGLVRLCETIREQCFPKPSEAPAKPAVHTQARPDVVLLGGTGFVGAHTTRLLSSDGRQVRVVARSMRNLSSLFDKPNIELVSASIGNSEAVAAAIRDVPVVVNLAHGGGGANYAAIERAMVGGAEIVAHACLAAGTRRLLHIGSIASLYLGDKDAVITGETPPDPQSERRGDYARAKAVADRRLLAMHAEQGLRLVLLRPGVVVGEFSSPFHSGLGFFNNEQHCMGWNDGTNPLPFVLAGDTAGAILLAGDAAGIDGRAFNLVGDVRLTAREYIAALAATMGRPLRFHPQSARQLWLEDMGKFAIKRVSGRASAAPELRDFLSRGMLSRFDTSDVKQALGWAPVSDRAVFEAEAIAVHA